MDWGMKVSKPGFNVSTTDPRNLLLHSNWQMLKYHSDNVANATINAGETDVHVDFPHSLGYVPAFIAYREFQSQWAFIPGIPRNIGFSAHFYAYADATKIRCGYMVDTGVFGSFVANYTNLRAQIRGSIGSNGFFSVGNTSGTIFDGAIRFTSVTIPQGTSISSAQLSYAVQQQGSGSGHSKFKTFGIAENNTVAFSDDPMGRPRTSASDTNDGSIPSNGNYIQPNVTSIVQEIINRPGWASGNAMGFLAIDNGSPNNVYIEDDLGNGIESHLTIVFGSAQSFRFRAVIFKDKIA